MEKGEQLSFVHKREIVQRLARFDTPTEVAKAFKTDYGLNLSLPRILFYDPTSKAGAALSEELKALFKETRQAFLKDLEAIPIANKAVRLRRLDRMAARAEESGNMVLAAELGELAAKEVGGAFTNKHQHELTGKDGKDLPATSAATVTVFALPDNGRG
ncbi:conserved hypothetical protein [Bradyrhizobium sp. STM 3843]|uniref:DUF2280 domain-containing protein n=1 Tax=Bradyrhizobium sp. STM 3843 TaxID=551947 RepID=UPI0002406B99|nr:DUF2280 domain-containing protein [Bradyrhizobium sp. STM 3843]CCE05783.1 conserved hypothetical protein [Bradyrhizobium sp. STM 3843]